MNIMSKCNKVKAEKWVRYARNLTTPIGQGETAVTGCAEHIALSRHVAGEGMVLLENDGILPLKEGTRVSLFGMGSLDYVKGGGGSGMVFCAYVKNIYEGFKEKEPYVTVNDTVTRFYYEYACSVLQENPDCDFIADPEVPVEVIKRAASESDVAIITIHRYSQEGYDRSSEKGDFYLTENEQKMIDDVTAAFPAAVTVLDIGGMIDVEWIKENPVIRGALLAWQAGMEGGSAIADVLCGDVNPSGKTIDTFAKRFLDYPSADTYAATDNDPNEDYYVDYFEDIYVGYRYFETIPGAAEKVNYPFGYGLSYTTFSLSKPIACESNGRIAVTVTVCNTGRVPGKEVVQVYYSAPQGVLGKPARELAAFRKTRLLAPGESETVTTDFAVCDMASYDDLGKLCKSAYVLEGGDYIIAAGNSSTTTVAADFVYTVAESFRVVEQLKQCCAPNKLARRMLSDGTFEELPSFPVVEHDILAWKNPAKAPDVKKNFRLIDVAAGKLTLEEFIAQMTDEELAVLCYGNRDRFPTVDGSNGVGNTYAIGDIVPRIGIPAFMTADGPAGLRIQPEVGVATTAFPCATLIACSWDPDLAYQVGRAGALELKENGLAFWLTPGMNIHRNPLCGRNFEYYSEDPYLSGKFAAASVRGIQSEHIGASAKHFACNNKEIKRAFSDSRVSERALREIYLRGFEICVKEADPWTIMTSYNLINGCRCCNSYEQLQEILRDEWGFQGLVVSDWGAINDPPTMIKAGNDVHMPGGDYHALLKAIADGKLERGHLENNARHILNVMLRFD